jgi:hypothetical protein
VLIAVPGNDTQTKRKQPPGIEKKQVSDFLWQDLPVACMVFFIQRPEINALVGNNQFAVYLFLRLAKLCTSSHQDHFIGL